MLSEYVEGKLKMYKRVTTLAVAIALIHPVYEGVKYITSFPEKTPIVELLEDCNKNFNSVTARRDLNKVPIKLVNPGYQGEFDTIISNVAGSLGDLSSKIDEDRMKIRKSDEYQAYHAQVKENNNNRGDLARSLAAPIFVLLASWLGYSRVKKRLEKAEEERRAIYN